LIAGATGRADGEPANGGLLAILGQRGSLPVDAFMELALTHPEFGYYRRQEAIGAAGDFVTAPEISQVFGELIGIWCLAVWDAMGRPAQWRIVEYGPGRGTLMRDMIRAMHVLPDGLAGVSIELVEISETLAGLQRRTLADLTTPVTWSPTLTPSGHATVVIANEFLDALPIAQWILSDDGWCERSVAPSDDGKPDFSIGAPKPLPVHAQTTLQDTTTTTGAIFEARPGFAPLLQTFADQAARAPFASLFIDYGHTKSGFGDTLQAVRQHAYVSPFDAPGTADLTAQVDFAAFTHAAASAGLQPTPIMTQSEFLGRLGIIERTSRLTRSADARTRATIEAGIARLLSPDAMGTRFKVVGLSASPTLAGAAMVDLPILSRPV
jgi:NADH dehydrogenase [ubiquinone] 1 alpha subcomplex assembly factor 7